MWQVHVRACECGCDSGCVLGCVFLVLAFAMQGLLEYHDEDFSERAWAVKPLLERLKLNCSGVESSKPQ